MGAEESKPKVGPTEIEVNTEWARILSVDQTSRDVKCTSPIVGEEIFVISELFSKSECGILIEEAEKHGFGTTNYPKHYRGNLRLTAVDASLAAAVWERLKAYLPKSVQENGKEYHVVGLNDHWRLAKYLPGDRFGEHIDAHFTDPKTQHKTMFTVNIYMNGGFEGGNTTFHLSEQEPVDVVPEAGLCLLFRQPPAKRYKHEGKVLESGVKYLFRTDVVYAPLELDMNFVN